MLVSSVDSFVTVSSLEHLLSLNYTDNCTLETLAIYVVKLTLTEISSRYLFKRWSSDFVVQSKRVPKGSFR